MQQPDDLLHGKGVPWLENGHINVIDDFSYTSENDEYNADYLLWRRCAKGPHIYRFTDRIDENVYVAVDVSGDSSVQQTAATAERSALMWCGQYIGASLLIFLLAELIGGSLLIGVLRLFGIDIRLDFLSLKMDGSQWAVVAVRSVVLLLKYLLPTVLLVKICGISRAISMPIRFGGFPEMLAAVGCGVLISGIYSLAAHTTGIDSAQALFSYKDASAIITYGLFDVLIASALMEYFLRGCILTLLRQFGDPFAVISTALIAFLFPNAPADRISELLIGLAAGYLFVRSGSLPKCCLIRIIYSLLAYARLVLIYTNRAMQLWEYALLMISMGVVVLALYSRGRKDKLRLDNRETALPNSGKGTILLQSVTMLPWAAASLLLTLLQIFY